MSSVASRLYRGELDFNVVGRARLWFAISGIAIIISIIALIYPGLNFSIEFKGGAQFSAFVTKPVTQHEVQDALGDVAQQVQVTTGKSPQVLVQTQQLSEGQVAQIRGKLAALTGSPQVSVESIGSTWGSTVTRKALEALLVFLLAIVVYVSLRFEFKMAVAAIVALIHDLIITAGVYALVGLSVSPATVIAILTILGYSLYDTVVVFDKVRENTEGMSAVSRTSYSDLANRAVNQTIVRSINTSLSSLLPVAALLIVGFVFIGADTIKDLALALLVGITSGTYSSIFIATPFLAVWKETEPRNRQLRARLARQGALGVADGGGGRRKAAAVSASAARDGGRGKAVGAATGRPQSQGGGKRAAIAAPEEPAVPTAPGLVADDEFDADADGAALATDGAIATAAALEAADRKITAPAPRGTPRPRPAGRSSKGGGKSRSNAAKRRRR